LIFSPILTYFWQIFITYLFTFSISGSLASNVEKISQAIRTHGGIENSWPWTLDVTFSLRQQSHS